jgi:hypothetical protein
LTTDKEAGNVRSESPHTAGAMAWQARVMIDGRRKSVLRAT